MHHAAMHHAAMHPTAKLLLACSLTCFVASALHAADAIPHIGPVGEVVKIAGDFEFTEGPADDGQGNVYFSDIPKNRIYRADGGKADAEGKVSVFLEPSNHTNGLMFNGAGQLFACEMDGRIVRIDPKTKQVTVIAAEHNGKRFNAPNDLVLDKAGGVYFTDPRFRALMPLPQEKEAVYYADASGKVTRLHESDKAPNGVILSPDETKLYVIPSMTKQMMVFDVLGPGKIGEGKVFCELAQEKPDGNGGGDGLTIDTKGNLYITSGLGVQVFSPEGKHLGTIKFPEQPANVDFGGKNMDTLYVTARKGLYSVKMEAKGHRFQGK